ncbi:MAG TPA: TrkA C-terminal domain-containing protein [Armatimonadota bacterium]|jgi:putative transport protein
MLAALNDLLSVLFAEKLLVLFAILLLGSWIGHLSIKGISLGTAGVLAVALVFGNYGHTVSKEITDIGLLLFVYAVGLQAGPSFFRTFKRRGLQYALIATVAVLMGCALTVVMVKVLNLPFDLGAGLFAGALMNTPALASATETAKGILGPAQTPLTAVGYGIAYPFSAISVVLLIQVLPKFMAKRVKGEDQKWLRDRAKRNERLKARHFKVTNPACDGKGVREINPHRASVSNISRVRHAGVVMPAGPDTVLMLGDVVTAVGADDELDKMAMLIGEETHKPSDLDTSVTADEADVTNKAIVGQTIADLGVWEEYGVVITRIRRQDVELAPTGSTTLEFGDTLRIVGERRNVAQFAGAVDTGHRKQDETNFVPFLFGLAAGVAIGVIQLRLPNGMAVKLGASGGAFIVSLLMGHFGGVGRFRLHVPAGARNFSRELGLMLFLAGAGTAAGSKFLPVFERYGWQLLGAGALITAATVVTVLVLMLAISRMTVSQSMGALSACMTNPPALAAAQGQSETDVPTLAYASVYPVALILKIVTAQFLVQGLAQLMGVAR